MAGGRASFRAGAPTAGALTAAVVAELTEYYLAGAPGAFFSKHRALPAVTVAEISLTLDLN